MIRPDPRRNYFLYRRGGGRNIFQYEPEKKVQFGRCYFVDLGVRNAHLYPISDELASILPLEI